MVFVLAPFCNDLIWILAYHHSFKMCIWAWVICNMPQHAEMACTLQQIKPHTHTITSRISKPCPSGTSAAPLWEYTWLNDGLTAEPCLLIYLFISFFISDWRIAWLQSFASPLSLISLEQGALADESSRSTFIFQAPTHIPTHALTHVPTYAHTHTHEHAHTHICTHAHTHAHIIYTIMKACLLNQERPYLQSSSRFLPSVHAWLVHCVLLVLNSFASLYS